LPAVTTAQFFFVAVTTAHARPPRCSVVVAISAQLCGSKSFLRLEDLPA